MFSDVPAAEEQHLAGRERGDRDDPEDEEVVERLHLLLLLRPVGPRHQRGAADEAEIPADAEQDQRQPEMADAGAGERRRARSR